MPKATSPIPVDPQRVYFTPELGVCDPRIGAERSTLYGALKHDLVGRVGYSSSAAGWSDDVVAEYWLLPRTHDFEIRMVRHRLVVVVGSSPAFCRFDDDGDKGEGLTGLGSTCLMPQGLTSRLCWSPNLNAVSLEFSSELMSRLLDGRDSRSPSEQVVLCRNLPDAIARNLAQLIVTELSTPTERLYGEMLCLALAVHVLRTYGRTRFDTVKRRLSALQANRVLDYMHANLDARLSVSALAEVAGLSDACFARAFHATFSEPPHRRLLRWRLERAARLIRMKDASLAEASVAAGFCDQAHFSNAMRRHFGKSPTMLLNSL